MQLNIFDKLTYSKTPDTHTNKLMKPDESRL